MRLRVYKLAGPRWLIAGDNHTVADNFVDAEVPDGVPPERVVAHLRETANLIERAAKSMRSMGERLVKPRAPAPPTWRCPCGAVNLGSECTCSGCGWRA